MFCPGGSSWSRERWKGKDTVKPVALSYIRNLPIRGRFPVTLPPILLLLHLSSSLLLLLSSMPLFSSWYSSSLPCCRCISPILIPFAALVPLLVLPVFSLLTFSHRHHLVPFNLALVFLLYPLSSFHYHHLSLLPVTFSPLPMFLYEFAAAAIVTRVVRFFFTVTKLRGRMFHNPAGSLGWRHDGLGIMLSLRPNYLQTHKKYPCHMSL